MLNKLLVSQNEISTISGRCSDLHGDLSKPTATHSRDHNISPDGRRQRRKVGDDNHLFQQPGASSASAPGSAVPVLRHKNSTRMSTSQGSHLNLTDIASSPLCSNWRSSADDNMTSDSESELMGAVGQLSLNEDEQVRYHGKASGLYLLGNKERIDQRNEGGIWLLSFLPRVHRYF